MSVPTVKERAPHGGGPRNAPAGSRGRWWTSLIGRGRGACESELTKGVARGELRLHYQPKLHLRSRRIVSLEALVRWHHPERGLVSPADFIPAAEESNDIVPLSLWVLERAIADQHGLARQGHDMPVFVNIAASLLTDDAFIRRACAMVSQEGSKIGFEITETSVIRDPSVAIANLRHVAGVGIPISIDDYGAGLSSLAYLKQLPAQELKIDKLFITQLTSSHRDPLIVPSTIDLAHAMEMEVVAEGIETAAALALLSVMGCDMAQGFHISRPLTMSALYSFLDQHREGWVAEASGGSLMRLASALKRA